MSFIVRASGPEDEARVGAVLAASYPALLRGAYDEAVLAAALPFMTFANPALLRSGTYYLAETSERVPIGCGGWTRERPGTGEIEAGLAHLRHFAVHPDWTRRGVGRALYETCEHAARAAGAQRFECQATLNGERFYEAFGFVSVRPIDVAMSAGVLFPSILMQRVL
jgi:GNAT superfamily N-acetyltransferase